MSDEKERIEMVPHNAHNGRNHTLAKGFIAGAAVGVGLGLLFAPRRGSELRKQVKVQVNHLASSASTGYHRAKDTTGHLAHRGHDAYVVCRDTIAQGAHETRRYVREVADAVTLKSRGQVAPSQVAAPAQMTASAKVPTVTAQADLPGRAREQASRQPEVKKDEAKKDLRAV